MANGIFLLQEPRVGLEGERFNMLRMKKPVAPRRLGNISEFLRRSHAYDAPILLNVIKGDMALVGPQPLTPEDARSLEEHENIRFSVRPGLTDTYKIRKRMNIAFEPRHVLERAYLAERGVRKDLTILLRTIPALIFGRSNPVTANAFVLQDVPIANLTMFETLDRLVELAKQKKHLVAFANPHCFNVAHDDAEYREILKQACMVLPDGIGLKIAGMMIGAEVRENVNGTDLFPRLCERAAREGQSLYLLGAAPGVAEMVKERMTARYPGLSIAGVHDGFIKDGSDEEARMIVEINKLAPDFLLVAMGVPRQEKWLARHQHELDVGVSMGVGGLFDFYSGRIPRAPIWMREIGLEWTWRLLQEPRRMANRYLVGNPKFLINVWKWYASLAQTEVVHRYSGIDRPQQRIKAELEFHLRRLLWWTAIEGSLKIKRAFDIAASGTGLLLLTPLFLTVGLANKVEWPTAPIFYSQIRVGRHGQTFRMWKFRSMRPDADKLKEKLWERNESKDGVIFKIREDPRITRVGNIIRRYSIDELPQLWNVLKGDMSVVGPRPPLPSEVALYDVQHRDRLEVTPGLTCLWQTQGRSLLGFNQQVQLDRAYIQTQSLWGDIKLIARTIPVVMTGYGAS